VGTKGAQKPPSKIQSGCLQRSLKAQALEASFWKYTQMGILLGKGSTVFTKKRPMKMLSLPSPPPPKKNRFMNHWTNRSLRSFIHWFCPNQSFQDLRKPHALLTPRTVLHCRE
jgi:hypothetical protein